MIGELNLGEANCLEYSFTARCIKSQCLMLQLVSPTSPVMSSGISVTFNNLMKTTFVCCNQTFRLLGFAYTHTCQNISTSDLFPHFNSLILNTKKLIFSYKKILILLVKRTNIMHI